MAKRPNIQQAGLRNQFGSEAEYRLYLRQISTGNKRLRPNRREQANKIALVLDRLTPEQRAVVDALIAAGTEVQEQRRQQVAAAVREAADTTTTGEAA